MMVMTAKVDIKKAAIVLAAIAGVILAIVLLFGGNSSAAASAPAVSNNDSRVAFLKGFGWDVSTSPTESGQVKIPQEQTDVFARYNALQKSQGYDLSQYAGKTVMRYVYKVNNYPGATEPVFATLLVYKNQIIGGDITDTGPKGIVQGFQQQKAADQVQTTPTEETVPAST